MKFAKLMSKDSFLLKNSKYLFLFQGSISMKIESFFSLTKFHQEKFLKNLLIKNSQVLT